MPTFKESFLPAANMINTREINIDMVVYELNEKICQGILVKYVVVDQFLFWAKYIICHIIYVHIINFLKYGGMGKQRLFW